MARSDEDCARLLERFLLEPQELEAHLPVDSSSREGDREIVERLGNVLWDVFSNNHTVVDAEGRAYHLGSFRGSARFIAEVLSRRYPALGGWEYLDFYMGSLGAGPNEVRPAYAWVFRGLAAVGCRWEYSFTHLDAVDVRETPDGPDQLAEEGERHARDEPLPAILAAYRDAFGSLPDGWPHPQM